MVSKEEISRRLEMKRKGINPDKELQTANKPQIIKKEIKTHQENRIICPKCQTMNLETSKYCINCGNELKKEQEVKEINSNPIICPECGTENKETAKFCIGCGKNLKELSVEFIEETPEDEKLDDIKETPIEIDAEETEYELEISDENTDLLDKIKKAKELLDIGAISEEEFEKIKNKYLEEFNQ
ncbi:zinc-ribbon domain-containing protein [Methanobacterium oryzae]|uniref:zinc-ribbon domain-containing protein n=1 Tax=Methanobacterium oryzae TaxID=69540 RepID=UPI003D1A9008